eukprot:scaffold114599_cov67-Phaeocystis_antarctica.AAC.4
MRWSVDLCRNQAGSDLGQLALRWPLSAPDRAPGCPELRPASAHQPVGQPPHRPATSGLFSTHNVMPADPSWEMGSTAPARASSRSIAIEWASFGASSSVSTLSSECEHIDDSRKSSASSTVARCSAAFMTAAERRCGERRPHCRSARGMPWMWAALALSATSSMS